MKKLMIAAAIVCAAALSHGAACEWSLGGIQDSPDAAKAAGWAAYLMPASTYTEFTALTGDEVAGWLAKQTPIDTGATVSGGRGMFNISEKTGDNYSKGQTESAYLVLFDNASAADAKNYAYTTTKTSGAVPDSGADISLAWDSFTVDTTGWKSMAAGPEPVPEPTSGLLLLLGVASLALRRKQA